IAARSPRRKPSMYAPTVRSFAVMRFAPVGSWCSARLLPAAFRPPALQLLQIHVEAVEALLEELPVVLEPIGHLAQRARLEPAGPPLRLAPAHDQPGMLQDLQVLGHGRQADVEGRGELGHGRLASCEARED